MSYGSQEPVPVVGSLLARNDLLSSIARRIRRYRRGMILSGTAVVAALVGTGLIGEGMYSRIMIDGELDASEVIPGSIAIMLLVLAGLCAVNARNRYQDSAAAKAQYDKEAERPIPYW